MPVISSMSPHFSNKFKFLVEAHIFYFQLLPGASRLNSRTSFSCISSITSWSFSFWSNLENHIYLSMGWVKVHIYIAFLAKPFELFATQVFHQTNLTFRKAKFPRKLWQLMNGVYFLKQVPINFWKNISVKFDNRTNQSHFSQRLCFSASANENTRAKDFTAGFTKLLKLLIHDSFSRLFKGVIWLCSDKALGGKIFYYTLYHGQATSEGCNLC